MSSEVEALYETWQERHAELTRLREAFVALDDATAAEHLVAALQKIDEVAVLTEEARLAYLEASRRT
jgi:hypothetical protein